MPYKVETIVYSNKPPHYGKPFEDDVRLENRINGLEADGWKLEPGGVVQNPRGVTIVLWRCHNDR